MRSESLLRVAAVLNAVSASNAGAEDEGVSLGHPRNEVVHMTVAFHQSRLAEAESLLLQVSDPKSSNFGQYLTRDELDVMFAPSEASQRKALEWLNEAGVTGSNVRLHKAAGLFEFPVTEDQMRKLFGSAHERRDTGETRHDSSIHPVPVGLKSHVESIWSRRPRRKRTSVQSEQPTSYKSRELHARQTNQTSECGPNWSPKCIRELYQIDIDQPAAPNNSLGIYGSGDAYEAADLPNFFSQFANFIPNDTHPTVDIVNGAPAVPGVSFAGEQILDLSMAYPIVYPQNVHIFQMPGASYDTGLGNNFLDAVDASYCTFDGGDDPTLDPQYPQFMGYQGPAMCGTYNITNVLSISFATDESHLGARYVRRQCTQWMKMALQGVSVLVSSGDRGVQGNQGCQFLEAAKGGAFNPLFPGVCPYVTTVGATQVNYTEPGRPEVAVYDPAHYFWSGGGFSNFNEQPAYQTEAVDHYLASHDPKYPEGTFNRSGRAFPDVSMLGANVTISDSGKIVQSGGTSAAAPLFAAVISKINDERLLSGKRPIGFLNQILYQHPEVFNDITDGSNPGCETGGFQAAEGWDPVSGLGSPNFPKLRDLLVNLP
ncbi:peptidase S8/S53 domain-containing protein [Boeremia exigua]|uniref:peptidase S8/S53 domain-containing protein n=1 Tax=Boeremia exigua TaxID=749465 RepID=UPI001E8EC2DA|nr:peptidase S8/S53 domain-containing protein [Boeremia exigua]KAH6616788.1 peptidase S8/S53 domain-containing protein [Boeremia exigua]